MKSNHIQGNTHPLLQRQIHIQLQYSVICGDKTAMDLFVGAVESRTIQQGTSEKSCLPMHQVTGTLTTFPAVDPAIAHKPVPAPSSQPHLGAGLR